MKCHRRSDPVTPEIRLAVLERDGDCVAWLLGAPDPCSGPITLDHVKDEPRMGVRAPSDAEHLVAICRRHHVDTPWATSHRSLLRAYLRHVQTMPAAQAVLRAVA